MLRKCTYGGKQACLRQGGDGSTHHASDYEHTYPTVEEAGLPVGDFVYKSSTMDETYLLNDFIVDFNEEEAHSVLSLSVSEGIDANDLFKSLYDFDVNTPDGVKKLMSLLPVLDSLILVDLMEKIWPGYAVEAEDPELLRAEIKGYLLDFLFEAA